MCLWQQGIKTLLVYDGNNIIVGIVLEAYSPLGNPGTPIRKSEDPSVLHDPVVTDIAEKHKITIGQVLLYFFIYSLVDHQARSLGCIIVRFLLG